MKTVLPRFAPIPTPKTVVVKVRVQKPVPIVIDKAVSILDGEHPAHAAFVKWLGDKQPTKRQARKFCKLMGRAA